MDWSRGRQVIQSLMQIMCLPAPVGDSATEKKQFRTTQKFPLQRVVNFGQDFAFLDPVSSHTNR
jgi:hypothetical protein